MTDTFILSRILWESTFQVGPYRVPRYLLPKQPNSRIDLQSSRQTQLIRGQGNPNNQGFEIFLINNPDLPPSIRELPIIAPVESPKNYYLLDYFFPTLGLAIELDSKTFHQKKKDREKDNDLKLLGIDILRVYGFWDPTKRKDLEEYVKSVILGYKENELPFPIDYQSQVVKDFRLRHQEALGILESKPMSGIDLNLYVLEEDEMKVCQGCMDELKLLYQGKSYKTL